MASHASSMASTSGKPSMAHGAWRISEIALLTWAALGGSLGAFLGMHFFHHKTRHKKFRLLVPLFMVIHLSLIAWFAVNA